MLPSQRPKFSEPIQYAPSSDARERRASFARLTRRLLTVALASVALAWGWRFARQVQYLGWQKQCMDFSMPAGAVVFDGAFKPAPACVMKLLPDSVFGSYAFVHERRTKNGPSRLILVAVDGQRPGLAFIASSYLPATIRPRSVVSDEVSNLTAQNNWATKIKVFAGQGDPTDESHFTIQSIEDDLTRTYDGWLQENGRVVIEARRN